MRKNAANAVRRLQMLTRFSDRIIVRDSNCRRWRWGGSAGRLALVVLWMADVVGACESKVVEAKICRRCAF